MDAIEIILYVVIMIVWVIIQNARKKKAKAQRELDKQETEVRQNYDQYENEVEENKPDDRSLIDEIIKELRGEEGEKPKIETQKYSPTVSRDFSEKSSNSNDEYETRLKELKTQKREREKESSRFDRNKVEKTNKTDDEEFENDYTSLIFEDPDSPRKAIILSEILNRKHF